jgi:dTDP-glucose pyrophosphorylase
MRHYREHLILSGSTIKQALFKLNDLSQDAILFVVDSEDKLLGSLTDGDVRRGLINDFSIENRIDQIIQKQFRYIRKGDNDIKKIIEYREANFRIIPILDNNDAVVNVINFRNIKSYLPIDAVIMAGGRGQRLQPLTDEIPKPLLKVGEKPIIEHNIDRLTKFGIDDFWISLKYLGEQIENHLGSGEKKNIHIDYVWESEPLGTIGAISLINNFTHDYVLVTNSDLLTNIDYEHFFLDFIKHNADLAVLTIPYQVNIPYAVLETQDNIIMSFKEKPEYTYYSNGGVYLMKKNILNCMPKNSFYNSTDLMQELINLKYKVISYPFLGYWLDIGKHDDFEKAQRDIKNFKF